MDVSDRDPVSRPHYREGQVLCASTLNSEREYRIDLRDEHDRGSHGGAPGSKVIGATVTSPAGPWLALRTVGEGEQPEDVVVFALFVPKPGGGVDRCLAIAGDGACRLTGALRVTGASVRSLRPGGADDTPEPRPRPWRWYQVPAQGDRGPLTRVELPSPLLPGAADRSRLVVGRRNSGFVSLLTTDAGGNTTVNARLDVKGPIVHAGGPAGDAPVLAVGAMPIAGPKLQVWVVNTSSVVITGLLAVITTRKGNDVTSQSLSVDKFLTPGQTVQRSTSISEGATIVVDLLGVLPGGRLCHAGAAAQVP